MLLRQLTLLDFRNVAGANLAFAGRRQFLSGSNGQGKTNLLEAVGFITALRSFRATDSRLLIRRGRPEAGIACEVEQERIGKTRVTVKLRRDGKELEWDGRKVGRLADHLGKFPTVVFSSQDLLFLRGPPSGRRRWLDLALSAVDPAYLHALQAYGRALAGRNQLLRAARGADGRQMSAFEHILAPAGAEVIARRSVAVGALAAEWADAYARLSGGTEEASLAYVPAAGDASAEALRSRFEAGRSKDAQFGMTLTGPHRDDLTLEIGGAAAKDFGSEGQQRSAVLALRLAQASWFLKRTGVHPVLLADDVLGELDPGRRRRFWAAIDPEAQVIATGTGRPDRDMGGWQVFSVAGGAFSEETAAVGPAA